MKHFALFLFFLWSNVGLEAQSTKVSAQVTSIPGISSSWAGEGSGCPGTVSNVSASSRRNWYHSVVASGTGSWTVTLRYSNTACTGPWTSYPSTAAITQASNPAVAFALDTYSSPAKYVNILITGNAVVTYVGQNQIPLSTAVGSISFPITTTQGGTGLSAIGSAGQALVVNSGGTGLQYSTIGSGSYPSVTSLPLIDPRTYGAICDGTTDDSAAFVTIEALSGSAQVQIPTGLVCRITSNLTLHKSYVGGVVSFAVAQQNYPTFLGTRSGKQARQYMDIGTLPTQGTAGIFDFWGGSQQYENSEFYRITASRYGTAAQGYSNPGNSYFQWPLYPHLTSYNTTTGGGGVETYTTGTSASGQPVLNVRDSTPFTNGQPLIVNGTDLYTLQSKTATTMTMTTNLTATYGQTVVGLGNRTWSGPYYVLASAYGGGDNYGYFYGGYSGAVPGIGKEHPFQVQTMGIIGGRLAMSADAQYLQFSEVSFTDQDGSGNAYQGMVIGEVHNFERHRNSAASSTLTSNTSVGAATVPVGSSSNFHNGTVLYVGFGTANSERAVVLSTAIGSVTFTTNLANTHSNGDTVLGLGYSSSWTTDYYSSSGTAAVDAVAVVAGNWNSGYDFSYTQFVTGQAIKVGFGNRIAYDTHPWNDLDAVLDGGIVSTDVGQVYFRYAPGINTGTVNTVGAAVTRASGTAFSVNWVGHRIRIGGGPNGYASLGGATYLIQAVADGDHLTLTTSAGTRTGADYYIDYGTMWSVFNDTVTLSWTDTAVSVGAAATFNIGNRLVSTLATGTAPFTITSTTPVANLTGQVLTYNHSGTQQTSAHAIIDSCVLGTSCAVTLAGSAVFTSASTYACMAIDATAAAAIKAVKGSGSLVTFTGTGTDTLWYLCIGN